MEEWLEITTLKQTAFAISTLKAPLIVVVFRAMARPCWYLHIDTGRMKLATQLTS